MTLLQLAGLAVLFAALSSVIKECGARGGALVSLVGGLALLFYALSRYAAPIVFLREMAEETGVAEGFSAVLRMMAVGCITRIAGDVCRDMGETTLASRVELCGRAEILLLALPIFKELCVLATELLG